MKTRAAVAFEAGKPLEIVEVDLEGPRQGEVLVEIKAMLSPCPGMTRRAHFRPYSAMRGRVSWWKSAQVSPASSPGTM
jgi:hypothetical protein